MADFDEILGQDKRFSFLLNGLPSETFGVVGFRGAERISGLYRFEIELVAEESGIDFDKVVAHPATLYFHAGATGHALPRHGVISEFVQLGQVDRLTFYRAVLVPRAWRLSLFRLSEVYVGERTTPQLIETIFRDAGFSHLDFELRLAGDYRQRSFVCQHQETYLDFIDRWLQWEGIYYYFDQGEHQEKMVLLDQRDFQPSAGPSCHYIQAGQMDTGARSDLIQAFSCGQIVLPKKVIVQDYNYRKSPLEVKGEATVSPNGIGEVMLYGENIRTNAEARRIAEIRAEEVRCSGKVFDGAGTALGLAAGFPLALAGHYRQDFNARYLVTVMEHFGSQSGVLLAGIDKSSTGDDQELFYRHSFKAVPFETQYRPPRLTAKPRFYGTMNATVDAEGTGQYAELNEYGQYKVQLPFDKTDKQAGKASAWLRMASPYAGGDYGMHMPVHKGAEVLLSFTDGDPDQPVIIGAVPNSENRSMVTNANQTQSVIHTGGDNRIAIEDREGSQRILMQSPTANSFVRIGAPNDPPRYMAPLGRRYLMAEDEKNVTDWDTMSHEDFPHKNGITLASDGLLDISAQAKNEIILGESSETVIGLTNYNHLMFKVETTAALAMEANFGGLLKIGRVWVANFEKEKIVAGEDEIKELKNKIDTCDTHIHTAQTHIRDAESAIENIETRLEDTENWIMSAVTKIDDIETNIQDVETNIQTVETHIRDAESAIENVETRLEDTETWIMNAVTKIDDIETHIKDAETSICNLALSVDDIETKMEDAGTYILNVGIFLIN